MSTLYRDAALTDARSDRLTIGVSVLVTEDLIAWIRRRRDGRPRLRGEPDAGVIRAGGPADFSLVHGDPLSDPTAMWRIWRVA